jgi:hypothetical protein
VRYFNVELSNVLTGFLGPYKAECKTETGFLKYLYEIDNREWTLRLCLSGHFSNRIILEKNFWVHIKPTSPKVLYTEVWSVIRSSYR